MKQIANSKIKQERNEYTVSDHDRVTDDDVSKKKPGAGRKIN